MPYQPTNPYPYNTAINLNEGLQFRFKIDDYDVIEKFEIELYDLLKNKKIYTIIRTVGEIATNEDGDVTNKYITTGDKQLIHILDENNNTILLQEYTKDDSKLPLRGGLSSNNIGEVDISNYLKKVVEVEMKQYYGDTIGYENLSLTNEECFELDSNGTIVRYIEDNNTEDKNNIVIPYRTSQGYVKNIGDNVFAYNENIKTVVIPSSINTIGSNAFRECKALCGVSFNYGVSMLRDGCFADCEKLKQINLLDSIGYIGSGAFTNCISLTELRIPWSLTDIESYVFANTGITTLSLPPDIIKIHERAFMGCSVLEEVKFNNKLQNIEDSVFKNCVMLNKIELNEGLSYLGAESFANCDLVSVVVPNSVEEIGAGVFKDNRIFELTIPFVGHKNNSSNTKMSVLGYLFGESETEQGVEQLYDENQSQYFLIPDTLQKIEIAKSSEIPYGAFSNCVNVREVKMSSDVVRIKIC